MSYFWLEVIYKQKTIFKKILKQSQSFEDVLSNSSEIVFAYNIVYYWAIILQIRNCRKCKPYKNYS